jgi:hypothetical protein
MTEPWRGHVHLWAALIQDVRRLPASVDVDNRGDHRTNEGGGIERHCALDPIRRLEGDHVTGPDAAG